MFKPLVIGSRMELVSKKSLRNNEERIVYASQILDFNDDSIVCAMPIYEGRIVPLEAGKRFDAYFYVGTKIFRADCTAIDRGRDNNIHTVTIQLDSELLKFQRREYFRLSCVLPVSVQKGNTLVALVHPDVEESTALDFTDEDLQNVMEENIATLNKELPAYSRIAAVQIHPEEFQKTAKKSIKRYLYQDSAC